MKKTDPTLLRALKLIHQCDPRGFYLKIFYVTLMSLLPLANLYVLKYMIDSITSILGSGSSEMAPTIITCVVFYCGIFLANRLIDVLSVINNDMLTQRLIDHINNLIQNQSVRLDMAYYDNPAYHDTFHRAQQEAAFRPVRILESFVSAFGAVISLIGIVVMLCTTSWTIIVVMVIAMLPVFLVRLYKSKAVYRFRRDTTQSARRSHYYGQLLSNRSFAQEVRSFGLADHFRALYVDIRRSLVAMLYKISRRLAVYDACTSLFEAVALCAVILMLVSPVASGAVTIGTFVMLFEAFRRGQGYLNTLVSGISGLYEHKLFIGNLYEFLELKPAITSPSVPLPFPLEVEEIEFRNITFSYPASTEGGVQPPALEGFCFSARRGMLNRLRGENGYGKSTALKLLLRLYDPQEGAILINGTDIRLFDLRDLRHGVGAIFQDHVRFFFTAKENILFGDLSHPLDEERLQRALAISEAQPVVDRLPNGLDTPLGRMFDHGEELSMGQWQRIALARQLYSDAPVLVFDEPTAWMDAPARQSFFRSLDDLKNNHLVILISHDEQ